MKNISKGSDMLFRKILVSCAFLLIGAFSAIAGGEQYVDAYNGLAKALNERLAFVGASTFPLKEAGAGVSQADLNALRGSVISLMENYFIYPGTVKSEDDISSASEMFKMGITYRTENGSYVYDEFGNKVIETPSLFSGVGNGNAFTMLPEKYVDDNKDIYSNNFIDIPLLWIHFDELRKAINKISQRMISAEEEKQTRNTGHYNSWSYGAYDNHYYFSGYPSNGTRGGDFVSFKTCLNRCKGNDPVPGDPDSNVWELAAWVPTSSAIGWNVDWNNGTYTAMWGGSQSRVHVSRTRGRLLASAPQDSNGIFYVVHTYNHSGNGTTYVSRKNVKAYNASWDSTLGKFATQMIMDVDSAPSAVPNPEPVLSTDASSVSESFFNGCFIVEGDFQSASISNPQASDFKDDGILATGCTCLTCEDCIEVVFNKLSNCPQVKYPLGVANGNLSPSGLKVLSYVNEKKYGTLKVQAYNLHTNISSVSVGSVGSHTWGLVTVKRPSAVEVVFSIKTGKPDSTMPYTLTKLDSENYEIRFPERQDGGGNAVIHHFSYDIYTGIYPVVSCRLETKDAVKTVSRSGLGQWPGLTTNYDLNNGHILSVVSGVGTLSPIYDSKDFVYDWTPHHYGSCSYDGDALRKYKYNGSTPVLIGQTVYATDAASGDSTVTEWNVEGGAATSVARTTTHSTSMSSDGETKTVASTTAAPGSQSFSSTETYKYFPWGEETVLSVTAPGEACERSTSYSYYENVSDGAAYGKLKLASSSDGSWTRYVYDSNGRVSKEVRPFGNAAPDAAESACRVTEYGYTPVVAGDVLSGPSDSRTRSVVERVLGVEVSRTYYGCLSDGSLTVRCASPGAAWDAAGNLSTRTWVFTSGDFKGRTQHTLNADGTGTVYSYSVSDGILTTTVESGAMSGSAVTDGTRTVTVTNGRGATLSSATYDIASGLQTSSTVNTLDEIGRVVRSDYLGGTYASTVYGCCGPESQTSRDGSTSTFGYDSLKRTTFSASAGITTFFTYDAAGNTTRTVRKGSDNSEISVSSSYDAAGEMVSSTDELGNSASFSETVADGVKIRTTTNPDGSTSVTKFNRDGSVSETSGTAVHGMKYEYGVEGGEQFVKSCPSAKPDEWTKSCTDFLGRAYKTVQASGASSISYYDAAGHPVRQADADGVASLSSYNAKGEVASQAIDMDRDGSIGGTDRVVSYLSDAASVEGSVFMRRTVKAATGSGEITVSVSESSADGLKSRSTLYGRTTSSQTEYLGSGSVRETMSYADGSTLVNLYANGKLASSTHSVLGATSYSYDGHNRMASMTQTVNGQTQTSSFAYDSAGRLVSATLPDGRATSYTYDAMGRKLSETLPDGRRTNYSYLPTGELSAVTGAETYPVSYTYDALGRMASLKTYRDFNADVSDTTAWNYASTGRLMAKLYADGSTTSYTYTAAGRPQSRTWARGVTSTYTYDNAGDLASISYSDSTPAVSFAKDRLGRVVSVTDAAGARSLSYNDDNSLASESLPYIVSHSLGYSYDALGRRSALTLSDGAEPAMSQSYSYDSMSRLASVSSGNVSAAYSRISGSSLLSGITTTYSGNTALSVSKTYDSSNRLTSISSTFGTQTISRGYTYNTVDHRTKSQSEDNTAWDYSYDGKGQITGVRKATVSDNKTVPGFIYQYGYDDIGSLNAEVRNGSMFEYTANNLNQYTSRTVPGKIDISGYAIPEAKVRIQKGAGKPTSPIRTNGYFFQQYSFDNSANPIEETFKVYAVKNESTKDILSIQTLNAYLPKNPQNFTYNADGDITSDGRFAYSWNGESRLSKIEAATKQKTENTYDFIGRRTSKKIYTWLNEAWTLSSHIKFAYDGWNLLGEYDGETNSTLRTYAWGEDVSGSMQGAGGVGGLLAVKDSSGAYFPCYDGSNIVAYIDTEGKKVAEYGYDAFGRLISKSGSKANDFSFRFSTKYYDSETGLYYYGHRFYSPDLKRWLSRDPIGEFGGKNLYRLLGNNAIDHVEFLGLNDYDDLIAYKQSAGEIPTSTFKAFDSVPGGSESGFVTALRNAGDSLAQAIGTGITGAGENVGEAFYRRTMAYNAEKTSQGLGVTGFHRQLAYLARDVYSDQGAPEGWERMDKSAMPPSLQNASFSDPSGFYAALFQKTSGDDACKKVLAFRGTQGLSLSDWAFGNGQGVGIVTPQYSAAIELGKKASKAYGTELFYLTGHSLGGGLASAVSLETKIPAVVFNPAGLHPNTISAAGGSAGAANSLITRYVVRGEILNYQNSNLPKAPVLPFIMPGCVNLAVSAYNGIIDRNGGNGIAPDSVGKLIYIKATRPPGLNPFAPVDMHSMESVLSAVRE